MTERPAELLRAFLAEFPGASSFDPGDVEAVLDELDQLRAENVQIEGLENSQRNYEQWLAEECRKTAALTAQVARVRAFLEDMATWCSPHGVAADYAQRGLDVLDGVDPLSATMPSSAELGESLGFALAAMLPGAEPVFCHHENAVQSSYETHQAGWGRKTVRTVFCPACKARAESTEGEPVLAPTVLNAERCTPACTERHTNGPGCRMAPDWSKPIVRRNP